MIVLIMQLMLVQTQVANPLADFVNNPPYASDPYYDPAPPVNKMVVLRADLNNDLLLDLIVRNEEIPGDRAGHTWAVYLKTTPGFTRLESSSLVFRDDVVRVERFDQFPDYGIFSYHPAGSSGGALTGGRVVDGKADMEAIRRINPNVSGSDEDKKLFDRIFDRDLGYASIYEVQDDGKLTRTQRAFNDMFDLKLGRDIPSSEDALTDLNVRGDADKADGEIKAAPPESP